MWSEESLFCLAFSRREILRFAQNDNRSEFFNKVLERKLQSKLNRSWRSQGENARANSNPYGIRIRVIRAVHRAGAAGEDSAEDVPRYIEIRKIEKIIKAHARFNRKPLVEIGADSIPWQDTIGAVRICVRPS